MESAREAIAGQSTASISSLQTLDQTRFFVQMGWDVLSVDTFAVPHARFLRGEITPLRSYQAKENIQAIIVGEMIPGSEEIGPGSTSVTYGRYWRHARHEAERLLNNENAAEYKTGLVEIQALREIPQLYDQFDLTKFLYDGVWPDLPPRNSDLLELLQVKRETLDSRDVPGPLRPILSNIYGELIAAVVAVDQIQTQRLQQTHNRMKMSALEPGAKQAYDSVDREMLIRTGIPEIHSTDVSVARTLELMRERSQVPAITGMEELTQVIKLLADQALRQEQAQQEILSKIATIPAASPSPTVDLSKRK